MTTQPSPRPWTWRGDISQIVDANGDTAMCCIADDEMGPLIVQAVNAHAALVAALERIVHLAQPVNLPIDNGIAAIAAAALEAAGRTK